MKLFYNCPKVKPLSEFAGFSILHCSENNFSEDVINSQNLAKQGYAKPNPNLSNMGNFIAGQAGLLLVGD